MPQESDIREQFTREHDAARRLARLYFEKFFKGFISDRDRELAAFAVAKLRVHDETAARADR